MIRNGSLGWITVAVIAGNLLFQCSRADVLRLNPVADTGLIEAAPGNNMGGMLFFNAGTTGTGTRNRGLLRFDLSLVPPGSVIESATLELGVIQAPPGGGEVSLFGVYRVLQPWGEGVQVAQNPYSPGLGAPAVPGEATWRDRFSGEAAWALGGGLLGVDFAGVPSSTEFIEDSGRYLFESTPRLLGDVQLWVLDPQSNFGWVLASFSEDARYTARRFASREDLAFAPVLTVEYAPVPEGDVWFLAGLAGLVWFLGRRPGTGPLEGRPG